MKIRDIVNAILVAIGIHAKPVDPEAAFRAKRAAQRRDQRARAKAKKAALSMSPTPPKKERKKKEEEKRARAFLTTGDRTKRACASVWRCSVLASKARSERTSSTGAIAMVRQL
jgi:hypothetical protein